MLLNVKDSISLFGINPKQVSKIEKIGNRF